MLEIGTLYKESTKKRSYRKELYQSLLKSYGKQKKRHRQTGEKKLYAPQSIDNRAKKFVVW